MIFFKNSNHPSLLLNLTFDLANEHERLITLMESTRTLDTLRSKPNRLLNTFRLQSLESVSPLVTALGCHATSADQFGIHSENEQLHISLNSLNQEGCHALKLTIQRGDASDTARDINVLINVTDSRLERPRFDKFVYNFAVAENAPLDAVIGQVRAVFYSKRARLDAAGEIEYRIVPFVDSDGSFDMPVVVDYLSGQLTQALNIDRERYYYITLQLA